MGSLFLNRLNQQQREELIYRLFDSQSSNCFICEYPIDLTLHDVEIDHVISVKAGGKDDPSNYALTHGSCNASKQDADLRVARTLARFSKIRERCLAEDRGPNLADILTQYGGNKHRLTFDFAEDHRTMRYSLSETGDNRQYSERVYIDDLSGFQYFFAMLPIEYLFHDDRINPRSIGSNISKLVKEFFLKRPQLHIALGWLNTGNGGQGGAVKLFDGQHKAAAQVLLGVRELPVRVFVNPDLNVLLATNTNAGTTLRQVAFDKSVQRHLGSALYSDRVARYQQDRHLPEDDFSFSEKDLVDYYKGESREMKRYILDAVRDSITHHPDNKLKEFVDFGGRRTEKPLSYSTVEKTFYSFFIFQDVLQTPIDFRLEAGENPRELEKEQILSLMNIIAEELFTGTFDPDIGTSRIENRIQKGDTIPEDHLIAFRMSKEEILYNWLRYIEQVIKHYFIMQGKPIEERKLFQYRFPEQLWERIRTFTRNLRNLPLWVNHELSLTVFGGKQNYEYWQTIFESGRTPQGLTVLAESLNLMKLIQE